MDVFLDRWDFFTVGFFIIILSIAIGFSAWKYYGRDHLGRFIGLGILPLLVFPFLFPLTFILSSIYIKKTRCYIFGFLALLCCMAALMAYRSLPITMKIEALVEGDGFYGDTPTLVLGPHTRMYSDKTMVTENFTVGVSSREFKRSIYRIQPVEGVAENNKYIFSDESAVINVPTKKPNDNVIKALGSVNRTFDKTLDETSPQFIGDVTYPKNISDEVIEALQSTYPEVTKDNVIILREDEKLNDTLITNVLMCIFLLLFLMFLWLSIKGYNKHYI